MDGQIEYGGAQVDHYHYFGRYDHCGSRHGLPLGLDLVGHPIVWSFYEKHDIDIRKTPFWTLAFTKPGSETVRSDDPLRLQVEISNDDDSLSLDIAEDGSIERTARPTGD